HASTQHPAPGPRSGVRLVPDLLGALALALGDELRGLPVGEHARQADEDTGEDGEGHGLLDVDVRVLRVAGGVVAGDELPGAVGHLPGDDAGADRGDGGGELGDEVTHAADPATAPCYGQSRTTGERSSAESAGPGRRPLNLLRLAPAKEV